MGQEIYDVKITAIDVTPVTIALARPFTLSAGTVTHGNHVLVEIHTDAGITGLGEGAPIGATDGETQASMTDVLRNRIAPMLIGRDPRRISDIITAMDRGVIDNLCAKAAIDLALHDLLGKALGCPVYQLLGGRCRDEITVLETDIGIASPEESARAAKEAKARGIGAYEVKIGKDPERDIAAVRLIREAIGPDAKIRIDANEGYNRSTALKILRAMEAADLSYIEQPLPRWDVPGMAMLAAALDTPICADQGAYTIHDVHKLIKADAADIVCIKIARSGLYKARIIAATCQAAGIRCTMGSMMPIGIGVAAIHHFAMSNPNVDVELGGVHGSTREFLGDDIIHGSTQDEDGGIRLSDAPGFGVSLDRDKVKQYARA